MICQECHQRPATLHFTKIINGEKGEFHFCEKCAQDKGDLFMFNNTSGFSINNLLAGLFKMQPSLQQQSQEDPFEKQEILQCDRCSMTFPQFVKSGRFGCSHCYTTFQQLLTPIYKRLHSGNTVHKGKIPKRIGGTMHIKKSIAELKLQLQDLIMKEEFEKAVIIRDEIRLLDRKLGEASGGGE